MWEGPGIFSRVSYFLTAHRVTLGLWPKLFEQSRPCLMLCPTCWDTKASCFMRLLECLEELSAQKNSPRGDGRHHHKQNIGSWGDLRSIPLSPLWCVVEGFPFSALSTLSRVLSFLSVWLAYGSSVFLDGSVKLSIGVFARWHMGDIPALAK